MIEAGEALGLDRAFVNEMARATMAGASAMLRDPGSDPGALKQAVRSPKGTTDAALSVFEADGNLTVLVRRAIEAAHARASALKSSAT